MSATGAPPGSLPKLMATAGATSFAVLGVNFSTGLLVARTLGPAGRGETAVLGSFALVVGWLASMGLSQGTTYLVARRPEEGRRIVGTSLMLIAVLGTVGVVCAQLVLPLFLGAQESSLLTVGRFYVFTVYFGVASGLLGGVLLGNQDFGSSNLIRFLQPATYLAGLAALAIAGRLTVASVMLAGATSFGLVMVVALVRVMKTTGVGPPSAALAKEAARYGVRVQGSVLGALGSGRLDLLLLPTILPAASIGLYSVAVNTTAILTMLATSLATFVLPVAARRGGRGGAMLVARMLRLTALLAVAVGIPLLILAPQLLALVYGQDFVPATDALRILVPGVVFAMGSRVTEPGLQAMNRPLAASTGQLLGLLVTAVGLTLTLRPYGIIGAAGTTTIAYAVAFFSSLHFLRQDEHFSLREACSLEGLWTDVARLDPRKLMRRSRAV